MEVQIIEMIIQASLNEMFKIESEFKKNVTNEVLNTKIIFPCKWKKNKPVGNRAVSYTHLTLPTIYSV